MTDDKQKPDGWKMTTIPPDNKLKALQDFQQVYQPIPEGEWQYKAVGESYRLRRQGYGDPDDYGGGALYLFNESVPMFRSLIKGVVNMTTEDNRAERVEYADKFEALAKQLSESHPKSRLLSILLTKLEEAGLWYAKLLREEEPRE